MNRYFTFSGPIGSGKSSVSKSFASKICAGWSGFGTVVKEIALERQLPIGREELQILGANLVENERSAFCRRVVAKADVPGKAIAVIDGLRHITVLDELQSLVGKDSLFCVYVESPQTLRLQRIKTRDDISVEKLAELERHSTETEVKHRIKEVSNFIAHNTGTIEECVATILQWANTTLK